MNEDRIDPAAATSVIAMSEATNSVHGRSSIIPISTGVVMMVPTPKMKITGRRPMWSESRPHSGRVPSAMSWLAKIIQNADSESMSRCVMANVDA